MQEINAPSAPVEDKTSPAQKEEFPVDLFDDVDVQTNTDNSDNYRLATKTFYQKINIEKAKEWLNKALTSIRNQKEMPDNIAIVHCDCPDVIEYLNSVILNFLQDFHRIQNFRI